MAVGAEKLRPELKLLATAVSRLACAKSAHLVRAAWGPTRLEVSMTNRVAGRPSLAWQLND